MGVDHPGLPMSIGDLMRQVRRVAKQTIQNASIGRAGIRVYGGGWVRIEDGGLSVTGIQTVSGRLEGSGTFDWTGPMNLKGAQSITGPTTFTGQMTVNGPWTFAGNGQITGNVGLTGDLTVSGGGTIKAGNIEITPSANGGTIKVGTHLIYVNGAAMTILHSSGSQFVLNSSGATMSSGDRTFSVQDAGFFVSGLPTIASGAAGGLPSGALWTDGSSLYRVA